MMSLSKTGISVSQTNQFIFSFSYFLVHAFSTLRSSLPAPRSLTSATPVQGAKMLITARTVQFCP